MSMHTVCNTTLASHADHLQSPAWLKSLKNSWHAWQRRRRIALLLAYDDHILADMGYRRIDLYDALALPFHADGAELLQQRKEERRRTG